MNSLPSSVQEEYGGFRHHGASCVFTVVCWGGKEVRELSSGEVCGFKKEVNFPDFCSLRYKSYFSELKYKAQPSLVKK